MGNVDSKSSPPQSSSGAESRKQSLDMISISVFEQNDKCGLETTVATFAAPSMEVIKRPSLGTTMLTKSLPVVVLKNGQESFGKELTGAMPSDPLEMALTTRALIYSSSKRI